MTQILGFVLAMACTQAFAEDVPETREPLVLRKIMQDLGKNMQAITDGISREDWALVENIASRVADHPQPHLFEKIRILSYVGSNATTFKDYDAKTNEAAEALGAAATAADGTAVIAAFATLQTTCLGCHQHFRQAFVQHFYEQS